MEIDILTPKSLFRKDIRYTVPDFQRPYVWKRDEQWEPLWEDVHNTAASYLEELERSDDNVDAERRTQPHFLGAVVFQQVHTAAKDIERREIIDGQQRITTLQLLLNSFQSICEEFGFKSTAKRLSKLVINDEDLIGSDENEVFKLWPTAGDRQTFRHTMRNGLVAEEFESSLIAQAHEFFTSRVKEWLGEAPAYTQSRVEALEAVLTGMIQMVVIDLTVQDDPNLIFETMNARGTPLLASDLIKNYVMSKSNQACKESIWGDLDDSWWRQEIRQGRLYRPRIDVLLNYWLTVHTSSEVQRSRVFDVFRSYADNLDIVDVMSEIKMDFKEYRLFEMEERTDVENMFHYRANVIQLGVITPVILLLLSASTKVRIDSLKALESFFIRRMICKKSTANYATLTRDLVSEFQKHDIDKSDRVVVSFFRSQTSDYRLWPNDEDLKLSLCNSSTTLARNRLRLILEAIENWLRTPMSEQLEVPKNLTIEHVMPQNWEANWPLPQWGERQEITEHRNSLVQAIGNLTLINERLNSALSNASWEQKRKTLASHSTLFLNKTLLNDSEGKIWNEEFIQSRSKRMVELVAEIWPGPDSPVWD